MSAKTKLKKDVLKAKAKVGRGVLFVEDISEDLRSAFKSACYRRNKTIKLVIENFMKDYVAKTP